MTVAVLTLKVQRIEGNKCITLKLKGFKNDNDENLFYIKKFFDY